MALTLTLTGGQAFRDRWNDALVRRGLLTGPLSYSTGGVAVDSPGDFGWGDTQNILVVIENGSAVRIGWFDYTNQKLKFYVPNTGSEVAAGVDLSGFSGQYLAVGR